MNRNPKSHNHKKPKKSPSPSSSLNPINIPFDILIEILKRLPLKALIRSTCVSKSWLSLLTSPTFINSFISHNFTITPRTRLFKEPINVHKSKDDIKFTYYTVINTDDLFEHHKIRCQVGNNHFCVCSHHGVVCLFKFYCEYPDKEPLVLWNPSIGKTVVVNVPCFDDGFVHHTVGGFPMLIFGFGFDSSSSSYKLVRVAYCSRDDGYGVFETLFKTQIYDVGLKKWRCLDVVNMSLNVSTIRWRGSYMNGAIHWVCNVCGGSRRSILRFKLDCEKFGEIQLPEEVGDDVSQTVRVVVVPRCSNEVLGVVCIKDGIQLSLWVMEQYDINDSWVKLYSIKLRSLLSNDMNVVVLSDDLVAVGLSGGDWACYCGTTQKTRQFVPQIWIRGLDYVDTYVESLLLISEKDGVVPGPERRLTLLSGRNRRNRRN